MVDLIGAGAPPNDVRFFVHKRIGRAFKGFVTSGFNPLAALGGFVAPSEAPRVRRPPPRTTVARPSASGAAGKELGRQLKGGGVQSALPFTRSVEPRRVLGISLPCIFPFRMFEGKCVPPFLGDRPGPDRPRGADVVLGPSAPVGDAVMGRFGAALTPGSRIIDRAVCLPGMVVAVDGLCYNRSQIKNSERMWPRGRRPLLSGGDMRAISIAARAASRLTRTAQRLQEIGLIQKPIVRKRSKKKC